jgi:DNA-binding LacI/PurR family transcriptional regulator
MGHLGAQELLRQIEEDHPSVRHASLEPELIIKESTAAWT